MYWRRRNRLREEIEHHLAEETAENISRGMQPEKARQAALQAFGHVEVTKERMRELDPLYWLDTLLQDVRFAFRIIRRNGWLSAIVVCTLVLGIGLNVSVFTVLNALLLRPWVRTAPGTFVSLFPNFSGSYQLKFSDYASMSQPDYLWYRDSAKSIKSLAAYRLIDATLGGTEAGSVHAALVSCNMQDVLGSGSPLAGRFLAADECGNTGNSGLAVLGETAWRTRFNTDHGIVGRTIHLNRIPLTVIGVARSFPLSAPDREPDVWIPYTMLTALRPEDNYFADPRAQWLTVIGRRDPNYSIRQVQEELNILSGQADARVSGRRSVITVTDGSVVQQPEMHTKVGLLIAVTLGSTVLLFLLACVNVTTLLLSRSVARQHEVAVRLSLGAGRPRLLRQLLTESFVLIAIAAALSLAIASFVPSVIWQSIMSRPAPFTLAPDWHVVLYCLSVALAAGVIVGLSPALESLRQGLSETLKGTGAGVTAGRRRTTVRNILVAVQVALSLLILVEAGLSTRAQRRFFAYEPGFETRQVLNVTLSSVQQGFSPPPRLYGELESQVRALPGILQTSYTSIAPWSGRNSTNLVEIDGRPVTDHAASRRELSQVIVSPEYAAVLNIHLKQGRFFNRDDITPKSLRPAVISETMARRYWPNESAISHTFRTSSVFEVIGICADVQSNALMQVDGPLYYLPINLIESRPACMLIRIAGNPRLSVGGIREIIRRLDPQMATTIQDLASVAERQGERLKPVMVDGTIGGLLALLLAITGVYGVVSFTVSHRVHEIGIRIALGARRGQIIWSIMRTGTAPVLGGLVVGICLAFAASVALEAAVSGLRARDPLTFLLVPILLLMAALFAIWIPARRAAAMDPHLSIRYE